VTPTERQAITRPCPKGHIRSRQRAVRGSVVVYPAGELVTVHRPKADRDWNIASDRATRGRIVEWSKRSRLRLRCELAKLRQDAVPHFVTLTWPTWQSPTADEMRCQFRSLEHRFRRRYPRGAFVWKLEFTKAGVPHLHLLVWTGHAGVSAEAENYGLRRWFDQQWTWRTNVQAARSSKRVRSYVGKYVWKGGYQTDAGGAPWGRFWGVVQRRNLPWADSRSLAVTDDVAVRVLRLLRKRYGIRARNYPSLSVVTVNPSDWRRCAEYLASVAGGGG